MRAPAFILRIFPILPIMALSLAHAAVARAEAAVPAGAADVARTAPAPHANPRLKLSYRRFSIANLDASAVPLDGAQLDVYALSRRYVRAGLELEGGAGAASYQGMPASLYYGLAGLGAGFQYPARVTPFVDGRAFLGVLGGQLDGAVTMPGTTATASGSAATYLYGGGIDAGVELYAVGRAYVSAAIGWVRTTWRGPDVAAMMQDPGGGVRLADFTADSFTFKLGLGI